MDPSPVSPPSQEPGVVLDQLDQLEEIIVQGLRLPLTGMLVVDEEETIEALSRIRESFPPALEQARTLIEQRQDYLNQARSQGAAIIQEAKDKREQMIRKAVQEAEHCAQQVMAKAKAQRDVMLDKARQTMARQEQTLQKKLAQAEQQFAEQRQQVEQEHSARQEQQRQQLEKRRLQALQEQERIRQETTKLKELARREADGIRQEALTLRQKTSAHCEELMGQAAAVRQGADHYARQVLDDLNGKLQQLQQVVGVKRQEWHGNPAQPKAPPGQAAARQRTTIAQHQLRARADRRSA